MIGFVTRLVAERGDGADANVAEDASPARQSTRLFECPDCGSVYISAELATCGSCGTGVESVPTERDLEHVSVGDGT